MCFSRQVNVFHNLLDFYISKRPVSNDSFQFPILWNSCHLDQGIHLHFFPSLLLHTSGNNILQCLQWQYYRLSWKKKRQKQKVRNQFCLPKGVFLQTFLQTPFLFLISVFDFIWVFEVFFICLVFFFCVEFQCILFLLLSEWV